MRRLRVAICLVAWLPLAIAGSGSTAKPAAASLVGTWAYVTQEDRHADGTPAQLVAPSAYDGLLVYTADGYVTAQIYPRGRKWRSAAPTRQELQDTFDLSASYFGTYTVDASKGEIIHHVIAALDPSAQDWDDRKTFTLSGEKLVLRGKWDVRGETLAYAVTWRRVQ